MNTRTVDVKKSDLLAALKKNRDIHVEEYKEMMVAYQAAVIKELRAMIKSAKAGDIKTKVDLARPSSYVEEYDEIIGMLEMSVEDELTISSDEYRKYVLNKWSWSVSNDLIKTAYLG